MTARTWVLGVAAALTVGGAAVAGTAYHGLQRGWWWLVHPDPERYPVLGIDVSHHNGPIDWDRVAAARVAFAWIKATEGGDWTDPAFRRDAARAGIPWAPYHFFTFCADADAQADHFLRVVGADRGRLPAAIDVERGGNCAAEPGPDELRRRVGRFADRVAAETGVKPVLYVIADQLDGLFGPAGPPALPLWYRSIFREPAPRPDLVVWQYHSRGAVDGIGGFTDLDVFAGSREAFGAWVAVSAR